MMAEPSGPGAFLQAQGDIDSDGLSVSGRGEQDGPSETGAEGIVDAVRGRSVASADGGAKGSVGEPPGSLVVYQLPGPLSPLSHRHRRIGGRNDVGDRPRGAGGSVDDDGVGRHTISRPVMPTAMAVSRSVSPSP
jgi:hypothetical protein